MAGRSVTPNSALRHETEGADRSRVEMEERLNLDIAPKGYAGPIMPYIPSPMPVVKEALILCNVTADDVVLDLGCGDGRVCVEAAQQYGARAIGHDISRNCIEEAQRSAKASGVDYLCTFEVVDIWARLKRKESVIPLGVTAIILFVNDEFIGKLQEPCREALSKGIRIVTYGYHFKDLEAKATARRGKVRLYHDGTFQGCNQENSETEEENYVESTQFEQRHEDSSDSIVAKSTGWLSELD